MPVLILGYLLDSWLMPINKILWTPSYAFLTAGLAMLGLGFLFWIVDVLGYRRWAWPTVVFGMNAIAAYVAAEIAPMLLNLIPIDRISNDQVTKTGLYSFLKHGYSVGMQQACDWASALGPHMPVIATQKNVSLFNAMFLVLVVWVVMLVLYVFKIFVKV